MEKNLAEIVAENSTEYEKSNTELKRQYIASNIILYNDIVATIRESRGSFGTGYPFYILNSDLTGSLPVIGEQIRYNNELSDYAKHSGDKKWRCERCLETNGDVMVDLKTVCKQCPNIHDELKPRKLINRLPDLDMWMICDKEDLAKVANELKGKLEANGFTTSDVDPVKTIYDMVEIVESIKGNKMPDKFLPIDTHLIDKVTMHNLICEIPDILEYCTSHDQVPHLEVNPLSLRKSWQKDDVGYNFVHDYLSSLTVFNWDEDLKHDLDETRQYAAKKYSMDQLYDFLIKTGPSSVQRRHETPELKEAFERRIESWKEDNDREL